MNISPCSSVRTGPVLRVRVSPTPPVCRGLRIAIAVAFGLRHAVLPLLSARDPGAGPSSLTLDSDRGFDGAVLCSDRLLRDESGVAAHGRGFGPQRHGLAVGDRPAVGDQCLHAGPGVLTIAWGRTADSESDAHHVG